MEKIIKIDVKGMPVFVYTERPEYKNAFAIYKEYKVDFGFNKDLMHVMNPADFELFLLDIITMAFEKKIKSRYVITDDSVTFDYKLFKNDNTK